VRMSIHEKAASAFHPTSWSHLYINCVMRRKRRANAQSKVLLYLIEQDNNKFRSLSFALNHENHCSSATG
jgi:hypothetical protein